MPAFIQKEKVAAVWAGIVLLLGSNPVLGQTAATATVVGSVTDPSGAPVSGAAVDLTGLSRKETRH
ncbi:MAG: hypothetical protein JO099_11885 [Acidobacteriia bacterium]|nr:hypothetical protein [Terriglobia bacterium]